MRRQSCSCGGPVYHRHNEDEFDLRQVQRKPKRLRPSRISTPKAKKKAANIYVQCLNTNLEGGDFGRRECEIGRMAKNFAGLSERYYRPAG